MTNEISEFDKNVYHKIRGNVSAFIERQAKILDSESVVLLDVAPQIHEGAKQFFYKSHILTADIDENSNADYIVDICKNNEEKIPAETFDVIVCTEVIEHTLNPFSAINEIYRILKSDGILLMSTPFDFRIHGPLPDCWRFTEHGLKALLQDFQIIEINALENPDRFLMPLHYTVVAKKIKK
jgi:SAM-dependent methyltransferase